MGEEKSCATCFYGSLDGRLLPCRECSYPERIHWKSSEAFAAEPAAAEPAAPCDNCLFSCAETSQTPCAACCASGTEGWPHFVPVADFSVARELAKLQEDQKVETRCGDCLFSSTKPGLIRPCGVCRDFSAYIHKAKYPGFAAFADKARKIIDEMASAETPLKAQVGGGHYKDMPIQPVEFIHKNNIPYVEGCVIEYVVRWRAKNGVEDLKKARHFLDMLIEMENSDE